MKSEYRSRSERNKMDLEHELDTEKVAKLARELGYQVDAEQIMKLGLIGAGPERLYCNGRPRYATDDVLKWLSTRIRTVRLEPRLADEIGAG